MANDLLEGVHWECGATKAGVASPADLDKLNVEWLSASVPGTVAGAMSAAGVEAPADLDSCDWWFRCRFFGSSGGTWILELEGLATVADVWLNGEQVLHSENMFVAHAVEVAVLEADNELVLRFAALTPLLALRRPRPRWKTLMAEPQSLRWFRTTLLGRQPGWTVTPAPVGPWRAVKLRPSEPLRVVSRRVIATCDGADGVVDVTLRLAGAPSPARRAGTAVLRVGSVEGALTVRTEEGEVVVEGSLRVPGVEPWWPHTHGSQPRYPAVVEVGGVPIDLGRVGFRTVELDRSDGQFSFVVNGTRIFCRGACWWPVDPVGFAPTAEDVRHSLELVRAANMNMVRVPGGTVYEDDVFWDLCDELGVMVWQDCMLGYVDPPDDEAFEAEIVSELQQVLGPLGGRPALVLLCGSQQIEEQAAFFGLARERWSFPILEDTIPAVASRLLPGVPYTTSSPTGGDLPFRADVGDCHYWGVGSLLRGVDDARRCGIRFMSEGLAFGIPPERRTVEEICGGAARAGHDPTWKAAVHHDTGRSWDLEDVRDFYVGQLFEVDPHLLRYLDPERALDLGRAAVAELMAQVFTEWRRPGSSCSGGLVVALRDLVPGAGWGVVDALGEPKAPWFALRRALAPVAVLLTDEGLNGLRLNVVNDGAYDFCGRVRVELYTRGEHRTEEVERPVEVPAFGHVVLETTAMFDGFRDLGYAYRYGPPAIDVVVAELLGTEDQVVSEVVHLPAGLARTVEPDVGLNATARQDEAGLWTLAVATRRLAQWVVVEVPGFRPEDSWFHLAPGHHRTVCLHTVGESGPPRGQIRALNSATAATLVLAE